ncbi:MAG TPA: hypothetical protein VH561_18535 [Micromonosporaceae bacterium]
MVGLVVGGVAGIALGAGDLAAALVRPGAQLVAQPVHSVAVVGVAVLILGSMVVQVGARLIRGQRRIRAQLDLLMVDPAHGPGGEVIPLPSPETLIAVRRLAAKVTSRDG